MAGVASGVVVLPPPPPPVPPPPVPPPPCANAGLVKVAVAASVATTVTNFLLIICPCPRVAVGRHCNGRLHSYRGWLVEVAIRPWSCDVTPAIGPSSDRRQEKPRSSAGTFARPGLR